MTETHEQSVHRAMVSGPGVVWQASTLKRLTGLTERKVLLALGRLRGKGMVEKAEAEGWLLVLEDARFGRKRVSARQEVYDFLTEAQPRWWRTSEIADTLHIPKARVQAGIYRLKVEGELVRRRSHGVSLVRWNLTPPAPLHQQALELVKAHGNHVTCQQVAQGLGYSRPTTHKALAKLVQDGKLLEHLARTDKGYTCSFYGLPKWPAPSSAQECPARKRRVLLSRQQLLVRLKGVLSNGPGWVPRKDLQEALGLSEGATHSLLRDMDQLPKWVQVGRCQRTLVYRLRPESAAKAGDPDLWDDPQLWGATIMTRRRVTVIWHADREMEAYPGDVEEDMLGGHTAGYLYPSRLPPDTKGGRYKTGWACEVISPVAAPGKTASEKKIVCDHVKTKALAQRVVRETWEGLWRREGGTVSGVTVLN